MQANKKFQRLSALLQRQQPPTQESNLIVNNQTKKALREQVYARHRASVKTDKYKE